MLKTEYMDDERIIRLYWDRDETAIAATAKKYGNYCGSIALNILKDREDAEECVNDTYLRTWKSIPPQRPKLLSAFLGKIVRNLSLDRRRYNNADKRSQSQADIVFDEVAEIVSGRDDVEGAINTIELTDALDTFLKNLSPEKRKIFICRYWYFDSVKSIASRCNVTENNVSVILNRLRRQLSEYLSERGFDL